MNKLFLSISTILITALSSSSFASSGTADEKDKMGEHHEQMKHGEKHEDKSKEHHKKHGHKKHKGGKHMDEKMHKEHVE